MPYGGNEIKRVHMLSLLLWFMMLCKLLENVVVLSSVSSGIVFFLNYLK